jgi:hypothetical protein
VRTGELGDNLYVVESGSFNVFVNSKQVATRGKGTCFGQSHDRHARSDAAAAAALRSLPWRARVLWLGMMVVDLCSSVRFPWLIPATAATLAPPIRTAVFQASLH